MKKLKYIVMAILACFVLAPSTFATSEEGETRASGSVSITSITEVSKTDGVVINSDPTFSGLDMSFNVSFLEYSDHIEYEATVQNTTNADYIISDETAFSPNDYLTYTYQVDNPTLKAHGESKVRVAVDYTTEVPDAELTGGVYQNSNQVVIKLLNEDGSEANPNTDDFITPKYLVVVIVCAVVMLAFVLLFAKKRGRAKLGLFALTVALSVLPLLSFAAETIKLTINAEVSIKKAYEVVYQFNLRGSSAYLKSTDYNLSEANCNKVMYLGEVSDDNKYLQCNYPIKKDRSYAAGETVNIKEMQIEYLAINNNNECEMLDASTRLCSLNDVRSVQEDWGIWGYTKIASGSYKTNDDDDTVMNFSNIWYNTWSSDGLILTDLPCTFTMPAHPVLLYQHLIE